jgi:hypothetical protein
VVQGIGDALGDVLAHANEEDLQLALHQLNAAIGSAIRETQAAHKPRGSA